MTESPVTPVKLKRRWVHEIDVHSSTGRGLCLEMPNRKGQQAAHTKITEAMKDGLGVIEITSAKGAASIDTGQIWAVARRSYIIREHPADAYF